MHLAMQCTHTRKIHELAKKQNSHIRDHYLHQANKVTLITLFQKPFLLREQHKLCSSVRWVTWETRQRSHGPDRFLLCSPSSVCSALHPSQPNYRVSKSLRSSCPLNGSEFFFHPPQKKNNKVVIQLKQKETVNLQTTYQPQYLQTVNVIKVLLIKPWKSLFRSFCSLPELIFCVFLSVVSHHLILSSV